MGERDDRLPTATLAEWFRGQVDLYQKLLDKSPILRDDENICERVQMFRQAADRLEELTAAADAAARVEERERCLQTIRDYAAECRVMAAESWTQGEALKYRLKAETADALAYALRLKEPTR